MNSELMRRAAITLGALLVYRIGIQVPLPGNDVVAWGAFFKPQGGGILGMVNIVAGGAVVATSLLYVALLIYPDQVAEKLKRYGSIVSGIEPGEATADHIDKILSRATLLGGAYLAAVVFVSEAATVRAQVSFIFSGLSALIVVCSLLDLQAQVRGYNFITISRERQR
jgi:preprotein translocase subunit SecY